MITTTPAKQIEAASYFLTQLQKAVFKVINCDPEAFSDGELGNCLERLKKAYDCSAQRLKKPSLRISTIGTTSSGKSTLVNAMIGRRLAPIEADEMSAGVLTLVHGEKSRLIVEPTSKAVWETGEWTDLSDQEIYLKLKATKERDGFDGVMIAYHKGKKKISDLEAPRIRIEAPILPVLWSKLLQLPDGVQFEILDLPGLKWVNDRQNLKVIQEQVKNTFSLVVLDYLQTDDSSRATLLDELRDVVEAMRGRTDAMLFFLNKINLRSADDQPIEDRLKYLREEIIQHLNTDSPPDLIGVDARLLYYVQCAWGPNDTPLPPSEQRTEFLRNCLHDCSNIFWKKGEEDPEVDDWVMKNRRKLEDLSTDELVKLFRWAHIWSGGERLWKTLRRRIAERFPELVIFPAIRETLGMFEEFADKIEEVARIRKIEATDILEKERDRIRKELSEVRAQIEGRKRGFQREIEIVTGELRKTGPEATNRAIDRLVKLHEGLKDMDPAIEEVRMDLFYNIIYPVREAFKDGLNDVDLAYKLRNGLSPIDLRRVVQSYGRYSQAFMTPEAAANGLKLEAKQGEKAEEERLEKAGQYCQHLYQRMKEALSNRAEFILQKKSRRFEKAVACILRDEANKIAEILDKHLKERKMFLPDFGSMIQTSDIRIPDTLFELPELQKGLEERVEKIGEKTETRIEETSCLKRKLEKTYVRVIKGSVSYNLLELPSAEEMAEQWAKGITLAQADLWGKMADWIRNAFESALDQHSDALTRFQDFFEEECDKQIRFIEQAGQAEMEKWNQVLEELKAARIACEELRAYATTNENGDSDE